MKNIKKDNFVIGVLITLISFMMINPFCNAGLPIKGFYPVSSKGEYCTRSDSNELPNNPLYKDWCKKNFISGDPIYAAYRHVAFNIEYTPEPPRVDLWQTPFETMRNHGGDCEDAILLFHELLPPNYNEGEVVWGFVHDLEKKISFPHVWFQLYDKNRNIYIVEPFSGDWNGIIPIEMIEKREARQKIIGIPNDVISKIMDTPSKHQNIRNFLIQQIVMHDWMLVSQIDDVFAKLVNVSQRRKRQQKQDAFLCVNDVQSVHNKDFTLIKARRLP